MKLTEDRVSHISHLIIDTLYKDDLVDYPHDEDEPALRAVKRLITQYLQVDDRASEAARQKILSQSKRIIEGSREWDILYRKYLEEELNKHSF